MCFPIHVPLLCKAPVVYSLDSTYSWLKDRSKQVLGCIAEAMETSCIHLPADLHSHFCLPKYVFFLKMYISEIYFEPFLFHLKHFNAFSRFCLHDFKDHSHSSSIF